MGIVVVAVVALAQLTGLTSSPWLTFIGVIGVFLAAGEKLLEKSADERSVWGVLVPIVAIAVLFGVLWLVDWRERREEDARRDDASGPTVVLPAGLVNVVGDEIADGVETPPAVDVPQLSVDQFEVTNAQYLACVEADVCDAPADETVLRDPQRAEWPVGDVSAEQAAEFCEWLGRRLPTELEWLRAAFGTSDNQRAWPWGNEPPSRSLANVHFIDGPPPPDPMENPDEYDDYAREQAEQAEQAEQGPAEVRTRVPVTEMDSGRTPDEIAHLFGNVAEWTSTSRDLCEVRFDCSTPWRPGTSVGTLIVRGESYESGVFLGDAGDVATDIHEGAQVPPTLQVPDIGFRCVADT